MGAAGAQDHFSVPPRIVFADASGPETVVGFTKKTFIAMVEGVKEQTIISNQIAEADWSRGYNRQYL